MTDPNQWVSHPPKTFVKIVNTSRPSINGQCGLVLQYTSSNHRYTLLLCDETQQQVSIKVDNLVVCGILEQWTAYYKMMRYNPTVRSQLLQFKNQVQRTTGLTWPYVMGGAVVLLAMALYFVGFSRTLIWVSTGMVVWQLLLVHPNEDWTARRTNLPRRWRELVRTGLPHGLGQTVSNNRLYLAVFTGFCLFVFVGSVLPPSLTAATPFNSFPKSVSSWWGDNGGGSGALGSLEKDAVSALYKLGFDDATEGRAFGTSLPQQQPPPAEHALGEDLLILDENSAWRDLPPPPTRKNPFSIPTLLAAFTIYRTLAPLGRTTPDGSFDRQLFVHNLLTLDKWKLFVLAFAGFRLVTAVL